MGQTEKDTQVKIWFRAKKHDLVMESLGKKCLWKGIMEEKELPVCFNVEAIHEADICV